MSCTQGRRATTVAAAWMSGRCRSLLPRLARIGGRPRLAGVLPDECGEYLHHGGMVFGGIPGDPLEGIDAADAHVELVRAELLDGLGEAVGYLSLLGQFERAPGKVEVQRCDD